MRILLLGKNGQLGWELVRTLAPLGEVITVDYPEIDLSRPETVLKPIRTIRPQLIVNATAYTAVDRAESEPEKAYAVNAESPGLMAEEARSLRAGLIHYSTDYVFDGTKGSPYNEKDTPNPLSVYGSSKLAGERAIEQTGGAYLIFRTSWVYSLRRDSFVTKVLQWARQNRSLKLVKDQISGPTWARMLAEITAQLIVPGSSDIHGWMRERCGLYHLAGSGYASRLEWGQAILKYDPHPEEQVAEEVLPAATADFPAPAQRPLFSALDCGCFERTFGLRLPDWELALKLAFDHSA